MDGCQVGGVLDVADPARNLLTLQMIVLITRLTLVGGYSRTHAEHSRLAAQMWPARVGTIPRRRTAAGCAARTAMS